MDCNGMLLARRVFEVWRADCNTNWPQGLVGLSPAFSAADRRAAALHYVDGSALQPAVITERWKPRTPDSNNDRIEVGATSNSTKEDWPKMPRRSKATGLVVA
jgi:hypothetical protein